MEERVFLTGDVHQMSLSDPDHEFLNGTEMDAAVESAEIAEGYGVDLTLFCTGKVVQEERASAEQLSRMENVELAGHTWDAFMPKILHYAFRVVFDSFYGPKPYQRWDIHRTLDAIEAVTGNPCRSWRGHAYRGGETTNEILRGTDVEVVSNEVGPERTPRGLGELVSLPINTQPDHDHIYHGFKTQHYIERERQIREKGVNGFLGLERPYSRLEWQRLVLETAKRLLRIETRTTDYESRLSPADEWFERLKEDIRRGLDENGYATILAHPACMRIIDDLNVFEEICAFLSSKNTAKVREATDMA